MVEAYAQDFKARMSLIAREGDLIDASAAKILCNALKTFDKRHAYQHETVRRIELLGHNAIQGLMDILWSAIVARKDPNDLVSERRTPFGTYVYSRVSENYRRVFEDPRNTMSTRY